MENEHDTVDTDSWQDNGGDFGQISYDGDKNVLRVTQTPECQQKVRRVLDALRNGKSIQSRSPATAP